MTTDDDDNLTDDQLLELPTEAMPGDLSRLWTARAAAIHNREFNEMVAELTGESNSHLMIFRDQDPRVKRQREEEAQRRAAQEMQDYFERSDRLLARIDQQERVIAQRRQEIDDNTLKLHDGRRVYVDGNQYRDENGNILQGSARDEAAELHRGNPQASTWKQKQDIDEQADELQRLRDKVEGDRKGDSTPEQKRQDLAGYEKEFDDKITVRQAQMQTTPDYGSSDYMGAYGDDYQMSTVPAFTKAAQQSAVQDDKQTETETAQTKIAPQPTGQGALKLG
jgi:hypothetical protein